MLTNECTFDNFVGNEDTIEELRIQIAACNRRRIPLPHVMLTGHSGAGKTRLANTIANELGVQFVDINSPTLERLEQIIEDLRCGDINQSPIPFAPAVVFFDESHELNANMQNALLKVMLEGTLKTSIGTADLSKFTFVFATTDPEKMIGPLKQRCALNYQLRRYSEIELTKILLNTIIEDTDGYYRIPIKPELAHYVAKRSRYTPRIAKQYIELCYNMVRANCDTIREAVDALDLDTAEEFFRRRKITDEGLTPRDFDYLRVLEGAKSMGVKSIAAQMEINDKEVSQNIEPFLRHLKLIEVGRAGRVLTIKGRELLSRHDNAEASRQTMRDVITLHS